MADKRTTVDDIVGELRSGMTVGIGGWGSRRKPMAVVRAICRSDLTDLTVVAYGGPDVGLLCATGKVRKVVCGFVTLDSIALDPHWRAARQHGQVEVTEVDEGMFFLGLQAAAWRVPVPAHPGGPGLRRAARQPRPAPGALALRRRPSVPAPTRADADVELVAMPALHLDAAIVHANRADAAGNGQILGPDPFFDALFLGAAERRFLTAERIVARTARWPTRPIRSRRCPSTACSPTPWPRRATGPTSPPTRPTTGATRPSRRSTPPRRRTRPSGRPSPTATCWCAEDEYQARIEERAASS